LTSPDVLNSLVKIGLDRNWHLSEAKWGRTGSSSLLAHSLTVAGVTEVVMDVLGGFDDSDRRVGVAASFFHDMLKEGPSSRAVIEKRRRLLDKSYTDQHMDQIRDTLSGGALDFTEEEIRQVLSILPHGAVQGVEQLSLLLNREEVRDNPRVRRIVHEVSDVLASKKSLDEFSDLGAVGRSLKKLGLKLDYHRVSVIRGVLTSVLHETMHQIYRAAGFTPVLFFPHGTVYLAKRERGEPDFSRFNDLYRENIMKFLKDAPAKPGGQAVGPVNASAVKSPRFVYMSDADLTDFWDSVRDKRAVKDPNVAGYHDLDRVAGRDMEAEVVDDWLEETVGLYCMFLYLGAVLGHATNGWKDPAALQELRVAVDEELQGRDVDPKRFLEGLKSMSNTKPKREKLEKGEFLRGLFPQTLSREEVLDRGLELCNRISLSVRRFADRFHGLGSLDIGGQILNEVSKPAIGDTDAIVEGVWQNYTKGKQRGTPLCVLCGREASSDAVAGLLGKSQTFNNLLAGGTRLQVGNKLRVCDLCDLEMSIRTLYTQNPEFEEYYLIPQVNMSPSMERRWFQVAGEIVDSHKRLGMNPVTRDLTWSRILTQENKSQLGEPQEIFHRYMSRLLQDAWGSDKKRITDSLREGIERHIERFYAGFAEFAEKTKLDCSNVDELVDSLLHGEHQGLLWEIGEGLGEDLEEVNSHKARGLLAMLTPNYALLSYPVRRSEREDHRASSYLRHLFRGCLLSKIFISSVVVKELRYRPLTDVVPRGAVKTPTNIQFDKASRSMDLSLENGWLRLGEVDEALEKLSSLLLLCEEVRAASPRGKSRKGEMTRILGDHPGRTLNRLQQLTNHTVPLRRALRYMNRLFEKEDGYETRVPDEGTK